MHSSFATLPGPNQNPQPGRMAEALRNLQHAVAQCHDAIFITDATGIVSRVNPAFEKLTGYSALELIGKDLSLIIERGAPSDGYQQIWQDVFEGKQHTGNLSFKNNSGGLLEVEVIITPVRGHRGRIGSLVGTARQISQPAAPDSIEGPAHEAPEISRVIHDLGNMLLVVLAHADLANQSIGDDHPSLRHVQNVKSAAQSAAALVHALAQQSSLSLGPTKTFASSSGTESVGTRPNSHTAALIAPNPACAQNQAVRRTILLVEDESLIRESSVEFLTRAGFDVIAAASGEEALESIKKRPGKLDLLITDIALPKMSGPELAATIAEKHPQVKVLLISGHPGDWVLQQPGMEKNAFLAKPFSFSALRKRTFDLLGLDEPVRASKAAM
jgi:PAS domain S-box-containing protein